MPTLRLGGGGSDTVDIGQPGDLGCARLTDMWPNSERPDSLPPDAPYAAPVESSRRGRIP